MDDEHAKRPNLILYPTSISILQSYNTLDIWNYIESLRCTATDLSQRVTKAQRNVEQIAFLINQWKDAPMFTRIEKERTEPLLNLSGTHKTELYIFEIICYFSLMITNS